MFSHFLWLNHMFGSTFFPSENLKIVLVEQTIIFASSTTLNDYSSKLTCHVFLVQPIFLLAKPIFVLFEAPFFSEKNIIFAIFPAFFQVFLVKNQHFSRFSREKPPFFVQKTTQNVGRWRPPGPGRCLRWWPPGAPAACGAWRPPRWGVGTPRRPGAPGRELKTMGFRWWIFGYGIIMGWLMDD